MQPCRKSNGQEKTLAQSLLSWVRPEQQPRVAPATPAACLSSALRGLQGAESLVGQQFERLYVAGQYKEAAECAAESPQVRTRRAVAPRPLDTASRSNPS